MRKVNLLMLVLFAAMCVLGTWLVTGQASSGRKWYGLNTPGGHEDYSAISQSINANQTNVQINLPWSAERSVIYSDQPITLRFYTASHDAIPVLAGEYDTSYLFVNFDKIFVTTGGSTTAIKIVSAEQER